MSESDRSPRQYPDLRAACQSFATEHGFDARRLDPLEAQLVFDLEKVWESLDSASACDMGRLVLDPAWGCVRTMLTKCRGHALAGVLLYSGGQPASAEVVSRSVMEASVNVIYILRRDRNERLARYLSSYIADQRERIDLWERSLINCPTDEIDAHRKGISQKRSAMDGYMAVVTTAYSGCSFPFDPNHKLPSVFERFREIGKEVSYRTEYSALCNQTHDAAEDLLNQFTIRICSPELLPMLELETKSFSRMMVHVSTGYFFEACHCYAEAFNLDPAAEQIRMALERAGRSAKEAAMGFHHG
jgi:hypothetical protein